MRYRMQRENLEQFQYLAAKMAFKIKNLINKNKFIVITIMHCYSLFLDLLLKGRDFLKSTRKVNLFNKERKFPKNLNFRNLLLTKVKKKFPKIFQFQ